MNVNILIFTDFYFKIFLLYCWGIEYIQCKNVQYHERDKKKILQIIKLHNKPII